MSHPPETISTSSRMLAEELATIYQRQDGHYQRTAAMAALIDAWVRVREAEVYIAAIKEAVTIPDKLLDYPCDREEELVMNAIAEVKNRILALTTARKQLGEKA